MSRESELGHLCVGKVFVQVTAEGEPLFHARDTGTVTAASFGTHSHGNSLPEPHLCGAEVGTVELGPRYLCIGNTTHLDFQVHAGSGASEPQQCEVVNRRAVPYGMPITATHPTVELEAGRRMVRS